MQLVRKSAGLATGALAVALLAVGCSTSGDSDHNAKIAPGARDVDVAASSFDFEPEEITVQAGEDLAIRMTSDDIFHDFVVEKPELHVVGANGGETKRGGLRLDEPGRYTFYCSVSGHRAAGMEGTIVVEE